MSRLISTIGWSFGLLFSVAAMGQTRPPQFKDYPVAERYTGRRVAPKLKTGTDAWYFRTRIREAAKQPPNFAGHYVLAMWGCGAECLSSAIIDIKTGAVCFNDMTTCCYFSEHAARLPANFEPIDFRLNSQLVIFTGLLDEEGTNGSHYLRFDGRMLKVLR